MEQADQAVDQTVQNIEKDVKDNADETVYLDFDVDTEVDDLYMASDPDDDDFCSDNPEEEPHYDAKRKLAEWASNPNISHSALSELLTIILELGLDLPKDLRTLLSTVKECDVKDPGPVGGGASSTQIPSPRPLRVLGAQGQFSKELFISQPTYLVPGDYSQFDLHEGRSLARAIPGHSAAHENFHARILSAAQNISEDARSHGLSITSHAVGPASYAPTTVAWSLLTQGESGVRCNPGSLDEPLLYS
ncbi:hypothetical protein DPX16_3529 [Anabarilius grahami]|uniref:Uncharacterized protein n=1 Tax=Anabarilius grahami TaxID=495550 RepID=A0A3N0YX49_ANAGA|nr:hypothetical protein DPX16_3529 [Anabarilius grahami]